MDPLKYAVVERERRWLLGGTPDPGAGETVTIVDRYVRGTRLRLREVTAADGSVVRKLGHKVRLGDGPAEVACTSLYLDDDEWDLLVALPADHLAKRRTRATHAHAVLVVDEFLGGLAGLVLGEVDRRDGPPVDAPGSWDVVREVTADEAFTGAGLAAAGQLPSSLRSRWSSAIEP